MSICGRCGLDLETGTRIVLDDDLMPEAPPRPPGPPIMVTVIALVSLIGSLILAIYSSVQWSNGLDGWQYFIPVCLFGAFAAIHLLRGHSAKLLLVAMTLGVMVDVVAFIAMPVIAADSGNADVKPRPPDNDPDSPDTFIAPVTDRLDVQRIELGIVILLLYAGVAAYLVSPAVRRHYANARS
jgi:hypothetical protein